MPSVTDTIIAYGNKEARLKDTFRNGKPNVNIDELAKLPNPHNWPLVMRSSGIKFNNIPVFTAPIKDDPLTHIKNIRAMPMRENDVLLAAYPKCGTHWTAEILDMLLWGFKTHSKLDRAASSMIEFVDDIDSLKDRLSPRLLNSHLYIDHLPEEIVQKKVKIVHVMRNAKDAAVSFYHHLKNYSPVEPFSFDEYLKGLMTQDYSMFGNQFDYMRQLSAFEKAHPGHPILHIHYEDLKEDPVKTVQEIAKFIGVTVTEEFCKKVIDECGFEKMKKLEESRDKGSYTVNINMYRKGVVGDWKNHFTVAQNEEFEKFARQQQERGYGYTLKGV